MHETTKDERPPMQLQSFTYRERAAILRETDEAIDRAGGWVLQHKAVSPNAVEASLEVQERILPELYAALIGAGLELTRDSHRALAERCNCNLHLRPRPGVSTIFSIRLQIHFLEERLRAVDLSRMLLAGVATA